MAGTGSMRFQLIDDHDNPVSGWEDFPLEHDGMSALAPKRPAESLEIGQSTPATGLPSNKSERYWIVRIR